MKVLNPTTALGRQFFWLEQRIISMRFFIALEIPTSSTKQIEEVQTKLKDLIHEVRTTDSGKLHLTIAFIGEQPDKLEMDLVKVLNEAAKDLPPFQITPAYVDAFPHLHEPKVFWVGVKGDTDKLFILRERTKDGLEKLGLDTDDRRYVPHISIAKINEYHLNEVIEEKIENLMLNSHFEPINITSVKLFESIPNEGFHTHNTLAEI